MRDLDLHLVTCPRSMRPSRVVSDRQLLVYTKRMQGNTYREIANEFGVSTSRIQQIFNRAQSNLWFAFEEHMYRNRYDRWSKKLAVLTAVRDGLRTL